MNQTMKTVVTVIDRNKRICCTLPQVVDLLNNPIGSRNIIMSKAFLRRLDDRRKEDLDNRRRGVRLSWTDLDHVLAALIAYR